MKKRKDGRYQAKVKVGYKDDGSPDYKFVYAKTKNELELKKQVIANLDNNSDYVLADWVTEWLRIKLDEKVAPRTYESYKEICDLHIVPTLGHIKARNIQPSDIRELLREKREAGFSDRRVQYIYVVVNMALNQALADRIIAHNPCSAIKKPSIDTAMTRQLDPEEILSYNVIKDDEYKEILKATPRSMLRVIYMVAWETGLRCGEILGLPWRNIDFKNNKITVSQKVSVTQESGIHITEKLKSYYSYRTLEVTPTLMSVLKEHRQKQEERSQSFGIGYNHQHDLVFPQQDGSPKSPADISQKFKGLVKKLKLYSGLKFHDFRHTHATHLAEAGLHPKAIQIRLGHATPEFTMKTYVHKTDKMQDGVVEKLEQRKQAKK